MLDIPPIPHNIAETLIPMLPGIARPEVVQSLQQSLPKTLTLNTSRISHQQFVDIARLEGRKVKLSAHGSDANYEVQVPQGQPSVGAHRLHQCGYYYIQESAASIPAMILAHLIGHPANPVVVGDLAASPGGKTIQLANMMIQDNPQHIVRANDSNASRMKALGHNIQRMSIANIVSSCINGERFGTLYPESFDAVLLDAPCSGEGTSFKSEASLDMRKPERIKAISSLQYQLIVSAYKALKPGGIMIYSTCTLNPYENEIIIRRLIDYTKGEINLIPIDRKDLDHGITDYLGASILTADQSKACLRARPHRHHTGGFFITAIRKPSDYHHEYLSHTSEYISHNKFPNKIENKHQSKAQNHSQNSTTLYNQRVSQAELTDCDSYLDKYRGATRDRSQRGLIKRRDSYNIIPKTFEHIRHLAKRESIGIPILRSSGSYKQSMRPLHGLICMLTTSDSSDGSDSTHHINLDSNQAQKVIDGTVHTDLPVMESDPAATDTHGSYRLMSYQGLAITIAKRVESIRKPTFRG